MKETKVKVYSPGIGTYVTLDSIKDETFSSGIMGSGFGIIPDKGIVYAPFDGVVTMTFPSGHAIGFKAENGLEVLVHIGIDTVNLNGRGFKLLKKENDKVKVNEKVIEFDLDVIRAEGYDATIVVIFTNDKEYNTNIISNKNLTETILVAEGDKMKSEMNQDISKYEYGTMCVDILEAVGGSENIANVYHCVTRLRIVPKNRDLVDMDKLNNVKGLLKVIESSGQLQCVVGTDVPEVYTEFVEIAGVKAGGEVELSHKGDVEEKKQNLLIRGLNTLSACVTPGLYTIVAGGMIKGVISLITAFNWVAADSDIILVLSAIGDAPFYFMPFIIGYGAAKRFKIKEVFGIMIAGILMYSTFLTPAEGITTYGFGLFDIPAYNYKGSIFPVILSVWIFSVVFHFIDKRMPKNVRIVFSASLAFLIAAPLFLGFAAPLGNWIAVGMTSGFAWLFLNAGPFAGALFCGIIPLTIIFGIKGWSAIELQNLATLGHDYMLPNFFYSNLAVSGAVLGYAMKMKRGEQKSAAISTGFVCIIGITEPALYGIALPEKKPLAAAMIGGAIAGATAMILGVVTYAFSMPGITSLATYMDEGNNFLMLLIVMAVAWCSSFAISFILAKKENN